MAVAVFGTASQTTGAGAGVDPIDITHTIASGSSDVCVVAGAAWQDSATHTLASWDPAGVNESLVEDVESGGTANRKTVITHIAGPSNQDDTSYTMRMDFTLSLNLSGAGVVNFSGVDQTTPTSNAVSETAGSGNPNVTVTTNSDSDDLVVDSICKRSSDAGTITSLQTEHWNVDDGGIKAGGSSEAGGTNPTEMDWTFTGSNNQWSACGMLLNVTASSGGRIMSSLAHDGGLAGIGGIAGKGGGLAA